MSITNKFSQRIADENILYENSECRVYVPTRNLSGKSDQNSAWIVISTYLLCNKIKVMRIN